MSTLAQVLIRDVFASRPAFGIAGRLFIASDTGAFYYDTGSAWVAVTIPASLAVTTKGDILGFDSAANRIPIGSNSKILTADSAQTLGLKWADNTGSLICVIDGGGSAVTTGVKLYISVPFAFTITGWDIVADQSGSISIEVDKHAGSVPNTSTDKISASAPIALSSAQLAQSGSISGWTTSVAAGDVVGFNVASASTVTRVTISLKFNKT